MEKDSYSNSFSVKVAVHMLYTFDAAAAMALLFTSLKTGNQPLQKKQCVLL